MNITRPFTEHPATVGETYVEHFCMAMSFAVAMLAGGLACVLHAVFPFVCVTTGSRTIARLHERMVISRKPAPRAGPLRATIDGPATD